MTTFTTNTQSFLTCQVGQIVKLTRPEGYIGIANSVDTNNSDSVDHTKQVNGFRILYPNLGKFYDWSKPLVEDEGTGEWVAYQHLKSGKQVIQFISTSLGTHTFTTTIQGIQVHDHASIPMGGPAFATYYSEPTIAVSEEGS